MVVSISLVLFFVGVLGLFLLNTRNVASYFKEQIVMTVYLKDSAKDIEITQLQKKIQLDPATKKVNYISKEEAAAQYARDIGEDFLEFLGYNPLLNAVDIYFNAAYVTILDSNLTTLFAAVFLFAFGFGPIRGFSISLIIGILSSLIVTYIVLKLFINATPERLLGLKK